MIAFPHAKINFGLNVLRKRDDGFHDIESVLVPIPLYDVLEVVVDNALPSEHIVLTRTGRAVPGAPEHDLCWRAAKMITAGRRTPGLRIHLHKVIPMGAGLGGGSSDGAFTLSVVNSLLGTGHSTDELHRMASELGSDCPFFLAAGAQLAEGRGERLSPVPLDLKGYWMMLVNPGEHVPTPEVYGNTIPTGRSIQKELLELGSTLNAQGHGRLPLNGMEHYVFNTRPSVAAVKQALLQGGAFHASMSGSGSSVFGLFKAPPPRMDWPVGHMCWTFRL